MIEIISISIHLFICLIIYHCPVRLGFIIAWKKKKNEYEQEYNNFIPFSGQDVYYIKKQDLLLQETNTVIPDCQKRFNNAYQDLKTVVDEDVSLDHLQLLLL